MRYGINFDAPSISNAPGGFRDKCRVAEINGWATYFLVGVATTPTDRDSMLIQADNGRRKLHVIEQNGCFGIYAN